MKYNVLILGASYGSLFGKRPDLIDYGQVGFGRLTTPEAWLSTWSGLSSNADLMENVRCIAEPTLIVHAGRDREIQKADVSSVTIADSR